MNSVRVREAANAAGNERRNRSEQPRKIDTFLFPAATIDDRNFVIGHEMETSATGDVIGHRWLGIRIATPYRPVTLIECRLIVGQPDVPFVRARHLNLDAAR